LKLITSAAAILLLGATGAFTYLWYHTNHTVKQVIGALAPGLQISYGSINSSVFPGILGISDVDIILEGKRFHADSITVSANTILDLYALQKNPYTYALLQPRLDIQGLQSQFPPGEISLLTDLFDHPYLQPIKNLDALGCKQRDTISASDMTSMGYRGLIGDISLWSGPQPFGAGYTVDFSARLPGQADYHFSVSYSDAPKDFSQALHSLARLEVESVTIISKDRGYNERLQEFCAAELDMDTVRYKAHHLSAVERFFRRQGIRLDASDLAIYRDSLHRGASKKLRVKPRRDFAIEDLRFFKPADYRDLLGISFSVNNRALLQQKNPVQLATTPQKPAARQESAQKKEPGMSQPKDLDWSDLNQVLHRKVIVYTESGGKHRGRVEQINASSLVLKKSFGPDSMSFTIDRNRFSYAERIN
jgi:hypothetical protein